MTVYKGLLIGSFVIIGIVLIITMTYLIPMYLFRSTDIAEVEPEVSDDDMLSDNAQMPVDSTPEPDGPVIVIHPFQRVVTSEGKRELEIRAETATIDQTTRLFRLTTIEEIVFFGTEGQTVTVSGDRGSWSQHNNIVTVRDNVNARVDVPDQQSVSVKTDWLEYDSDRNLLTGGDHVQIDHELYNATGDKLRIRPGVNHLELVENVVATVQPDAFGANVFLDEAIQITCGTLQYDSASQVIQFDTNPVVTNRNNVMKASKITVLSDANNIRIIWQENVEFTIQIPNSPVPLFIRAKQAVIDRNAGTLTLNDRASVRYENSVIRADDRIIVTMDSNTEDIVGAHATGNVYFQDDDFSGSSDDFSWNATSSVVILNGNASLSNNLHTHVFGDQIQLQMEKGFYTALNNVRLEIESDTGQTFTVFNRLSQNQPSENAPLIIHSSELQADDIAGELLFIGDVHGHQGSFRFSMDHMDVQFDSRTRQMIGLTGLGNVTLQDSDRLIIGRKLEYSAVTGDIIMTDGPVMWVGDTQIRADRFVYNEHDGLLKMTGNVDVMAKTDSQSELPFADTQPDDSAHTLSDSYDHDQSVYLTAGNGMYDDDAGSFHFQDNVVMKRGLWTIRSESLTLVSDDDSGRLSGADALGNVRIDHSQFNATGHSLTWSPETSILILRGTDTQKSRVVQGNRGSAGDEIRFFIDENRFVVEKGLSMIMPTEVMESIR
jgi:LPS export ABC transporter protein LptC/lipopolysaccharide transport protein LptA